LTLQYRSCKKCSLWVRVESISGESKLSSNDPNECLRHLLRRLLAYLTHLFNHCLRPSYFSKPWKEAKVITLPKPGKNPKFPQHLRPISLLSTTGNLFEKVILKIVQRHIEERGLLNASKLFGFRAHHSTTLQCMRFMDHITLNFNNNMSMGSVFLDILSGVRLSPLGTAATTGLLYQPQMIDDGDCGTIGGMKIGKGSRSTRRKPAPASLCPPQIPHDQTRARTRATAVGSQLLTA
jgi:hypothetical protein